MNQCSEDITRAVRPESCGTPHGIKTVMVTIWNRAGKTKDQIRKMLLLAEEEFLKVNPGHEYINYSYVDGKFGERVVTLMFVKKKHG